MVRSGGDVVGEQTVDGTSGERGASGRGKERIVGFTSTLLHPHSQQGHGLFGQGGAPFLGTSNAKLVFRATLVRDARGSGLYLKAQHTRRRVRPLRRRGEDV